MPTTVTVAYQLDPAAVTADQLHQAVDRVTAELADEAEQWSEEIGPWITWSSATGVVEIWVTMPGGPTEAAPVGIEVVTEAVDRAGRADLGLTAAHVTRVRAFLEADETAAPAGETAETPATA